MYHGYAHLTPVRVTLHSLSTQVPRRFYFGRVVASSDRGLLDAYTLRRRKYLGPTSMDAEVAFLMCNQAKVEAGWQGSG